MTTPRAIWRFADWALQLDTSGSGPIFESQCTTCNDSSEASDGKEVPEVWCLRHAGATGHTGFRAVTTSYFRAKLLEQDGAD
ncbi:hypothetical protein ACFWBX_30010 [Streptomyces sp. NPDC059991]|uniref:DUF7848 domain-containing protein n=1 Tax=Streptomyces sp. NPDC059991 TaxID=3347028 RepID=UPI00368A55B0